MADRTKERRFLFLPVVLTTWAACGLPLAARATPMTENDFQAVAGRCAASEPAKMLEGVARTESGLDPWALHDNTTGVSEKPATQEAAEADASAWVARGDSVDVGLMQINSENFEALGLTVRSALDACASLGGGAAVIQAAYAGGNTTADQQAALLMALSRYNTGSPLKGIMNGYARAVMKNVPDQNVAASGAAAGPAADVIVDPLAPPSWDISATAAYVEVHGAPWLVSMPASPPVHPAVVPAHGEAVAVKTPAVALAAPAGAISPPFKPKVLAAVVAVPVAKPTLKPVVTGSAAVPRVVPMPAQAKAVLLISPASTPKALAQTGAEVSKAVAHPPASVRAPSGKMLSKIPPPVPGVHYLPVTFQLAKEAS